MWKGIDTVFGADFGDGRATLGLRVLLGFALALFVGFALGLLAGFRIGLLAVSLFLGGAGILVGLLLGDALGFNLFGGLHVSTLLLVSFYAHSRVSGDGRQGRFQH